MLVGVPASGKSTFADQFLKDQPSWKHISSDKWIEHFCSIAGLTYNEGFSQFIKDAGRLMNEELASSVKAGLNLVWNQTNLTSDSRKKKLQSIPKDYSKVCIYFPKPEDEEWRRRLATRPGKSIPENILDNMVRTVIIPNEAEGFDKVYTFGD